MRSPARACVAVTSVSLTAAALAGCASDIRPVDLAGGLPGGDAIEQSSGADAVPKDAADTKKCGDPTRSQRPPSSLPAPRHMPAGSTMDKIVQRGMLIAGVDQNTYLFGYRNPKTGKTEGFDIDRARDVAKALFGDPNKVRFKVISSADRVKALQDGSVDIVARTMTINCERKGEVAFSSVYYRAKQRLLVGKADDVKDLEGLGGKKVCAAKGSTSLITIAQTKSKPIPVAVPDWSDCLVLLQQGKIDGMSTDDSILAGMKAQDPHVKLVGPSLADEPYGIGIPKKNSDMVRFVNGVLDQIRGNGQWKSSYTRWLGSRLGATPNPPNPNYGPAKGQ